MHYNKFYFQPGDQLTLVVITPTLFKTVRIEFTIVGFDKGTGQYNIRRKWKDPKQQLQQDRKLYKKLLFKGHNLPFTLDTETSFWDTNKYYHFVTGDPDKLRAFLNEHCLTLTNRNKTKIAYRPLQPDELDLRQRRLYTDEQILKEDKEKDDCPFDV
jgi:hypothetical protein